ncbi:MAG TPA: aminotransferase class V-fold PLP-dependent enzyme [Gemmatimonadales bacterium]|nr:aminotransferase class V-fold PLP-dependent enzyme [Gemmatimonadales bacterium]
MKSETESFTFDLAMVRGMEFPWTAEAVYLNAASIGPLPARTRRAVEEFAALRAAPHRMQERHFFPLLAQARGLAARLINADPDEIALATNTSYGINLAARSLPLAAGDIVVLSDREFPANVYPWLALQRQGIQVEIVPVTADGWPDEDRIVERLADSRVRVLAVSLVQFGSGYLVDLARLSRACRDSNTWLVVDAIQGVGQLPVDVRETPVDVLACGGQKWLLSPWGSGFVYVRRGMFETIPPADVGWMAYAGTDDLNRLTDYSDTLRPDARRYELVTLPYQDVAGFVASVGLLLDVGPAAIREHLAEIRLPLVEWAERRGIRISSPLDPAHASGIVSLELPDAPGAYAALRRAGIVTSLREGSIRVAPHLYNTADDLHRVGTVLDSR